MRSTRLLDALLDAAERLRLLLRQPVADLADQPADLGQPSCMSAIASRRREMSCCVLLSSETDMAIPWRPEAA